jgi:phosphatidylserine synthase
MFKFLSICLGNERLRRRILAFFPNAFTVMNAIMGLLAVFFAYQGRLRAVYLFMIGAALFDKLDGAVARRLGLTEPLPTESNGERSIKLGAILDDISDTISFCIAPAWIFYITLSSFSVPVIQKIPLGWVAWFYALLGVSRLVFFTLDKSPIPGFFKGFPVLAAALLSLSPLIIFVQAVNDSSEWARHWGIFSCGLIIFTAIMMNLYPIRYLHLGCFMSRHPWFARGTLLLIIVTIFTPYFGHISLLYMICFLLSPLITWRIDPEIAVKETRVKSASAMNLPFQKFG